MSGSNQIIESNHKHAESYVKKREKEKITKKERRISL